MENCIGTNGNDRVIHKGLMEELERVCGEMGVRKIIFDPNVKHGDIFYSKTLEVVIVGETVSCENITGLKSISANTKS